MVLLALALGLGEFRAGRVQQNKPRAFGLQYLLMSAATGKRSDMQRKYVMNVC